MAGPPEPGAPAPARAGTVLAGRYRLDRPLAVGGMARVWEAHDEVLGRPVAVKVLLDHLAADESFVARFRAEALAAARLAHPSVVSVYDTCSGEGTEAIVMELIDGSTLRQRIDEGPLDARAAARIGARIAEALAVAHRAGIVHRDVKPANVLLATNGRVVVTDFGIAKASEAVDLTTDQQMLGTAKYLAPEQVEGKRVDGRADVYALGVVLFEMVAGEVPFRADTEAATALARLHHDPPPLRSKRNDADEGYCAVVDRTLTRDPDERWPDAATLARALGAVASGRAPALPPVGTPTAEHRRSPAEPGATSPDRRRPPAGAADAVAPSDPPPPAAPSSPRAPADGADGWRPGPPPPPASASSAPAPDHVVPAPARARRVPRPLLLLVVLALLVGAVLTWRAATGSDGAALAVEPLAFDPFGTDGENDGEAALAVDGDPETAWRTERYDDPDVAAYKGGVGLLLDARTEHGFSRLVVGSTSAGWSADVYVLDAPPEGGIDDWGEPVAGARDIGSSWEPDLGGARGRVVLLWITRTGDDGRVSISDVTVEGSR